VLLRQKFFATAYFGGWALLLFWFTARDVPNLCSDLRHGRMVGTTPYTSTNVFLEALLRVPEASERFNAMFARLPAACPIVFVAPKDDDRWIFVYSALSYLAWPRRIEKVELDAGAKFKRENSGQSVVIFCGTPPSIDSPNQWRIGPNLIVNRPPEVK
jgi:hypothetical protein